MSDFCVPCFRVSLLPNSRNFKGERDTSTFVRKNKCKKDHMLSMKSVKLIALNRKCERVTLRR